MGKKLQILHSSTFGLHATRVTARARSIIMIQTDTILSSLFLVWVKILYSFFMGVRGIELPTTLDSVINMPAFYYAVSRGTDLISYIR